MIKGNSILRERTVARVLQPNSSFIHSLSRCQRYSNLTLTGDLISRRNVLLVSMQSLSSPAVLRGRRRYSTFSEPQRDLKSKTEPLPMGSTTLNKTKVDLRPAPKRVVKEVRPSNPPPPPSLATEELNKSTPSSSTSANPGHQPSSAHLGVLESTKYDFADAIRRGIFKTAPEGTSQLGTMWHNLKQYFWFYYGGVKSILITHRRQVSAIKRRIGDANTKGEDVLMTRAEIRFVQQFKRDVLKLLPFVLTLLILEEAIPFIVLYAPSFLPSTCLLPSQRERIEAKRRNKQRSYLATLKAELEKANAAIPALAQKGVSSIPPEMSRAVAGIFTRWTYGPSFLHRSIISYSLKRIAEDDALLSRENNGASLQDRELTEALEERSLILDSPLPRQEKLAMLQWWLKDAQDESSRLQLILHFAKDARL